jgi:hypothetical protein
LLYFFAAASFLFLAEGDRAAAAAATATGLTFLCA